MYKSVAYLDSFYQRVSEQCKLITSDYEIIMVNDGSPDASLEKALELHCMDHRVKIIDLSRNFGHHKAMMTGLDCTKGEYVFLIDSDLEEEPEWLLSFKQKMEGEDCDVVYGVQSKRKGGWFESVSGNLFYSFFRALTGLNLPKNIVTARLMTRRYVEALLMHREREVFLAGLWHITGFVQRPYIVTKHDTSRTTYGVKYKMSLFVNSVTSFSSAPLVAIFYIGISISFFAALYTGYLLIHWFFLSTPLSGWTSVMASIWLLGGLVITFLGVIGIYLSKIYSETKKRPYTIVRRIYGTRKEKDII